MKKQEIIEKLKTRIELAESDIAMAANNFERDIAIVKKIFMNQTLGLIEQLDEPPQEPCEYCECGINQKHQLFQFLPPAESENKVYGDTITFDEINFCPACGRKLEGEERL